MVFMGSPAILPTLVECDSDWVLLLWSPPGTMIGWELLIPRQTAYAELIRADPTRSLHCSATKATTLKKLRPKALAV